MMGYHQTNKQFKRLLKNTLIWE